MTAIIIYFDKMQLKLQMYDFFLTPKKEILKIQNFHVCLCCSICDVRRQHDSEDFMITHIDTMRTHIISMICNETNEKILNNIALLLTKDDVPPMDNYSAEALRNAVLRSREDIHSGRVITIDEMRTRHPRP